MQLCINTSAQVYILHGNPEFFHQPQLFFPMSKNFARAFGAQIFKDIKQILG